MDPTQTNIERTKDDVRRRAEKKKDTLTKDGLTKDERERKTRRRKNYS